MSAEGGVLLGLLTTAIAVGIPLIVREFKELHRRLDLANDVSHKLANRQTGVEAKLDMLLYHSGFDMQKVNKAIKEHKEELEDLQKNGSPSIGCIDITKLYRNKEPT